MLSSPDQAVTSGLRFEPLQLEELVPAARRPTELLPQFQAAPTQPPTVPPVFELATEHKIPQVLLDEARTAAEAVGYAQGWAAGLRESRASTMAERKAAADEYKKVAAERRERTAAAVEALDAAASRLENRALRNATEMENVLIESAFTIAEAIVGAVLRDDDQRGAAVLQRALTLAPQGEDVTITLSPADHAVLTSNGAVTSASAPSGRHIELVADESLAAGDALASWGATSIDARLSTALERVREVLSG